MANYTSNALSFLDHTDLNWELLNPFLSMNNPSLLSNSNMDFQSILGFSNDHFLTNQISDPHAKSSVRTPANSELVDLAASCANGNHEYSGASTTCSKRKAEDLAESSSLNSASPISSDANTKKNIVGRGKRMKRDDKSEEKPKEVVHVRARRGQATDSHSIAERIRRGKINERLKCLQDIVPGCNKTMGMAGMLDEIINYVQSLQNQVEFLSMKLTAASQYYDFNAETTEPVEKMQKMEPGNNAEAQDAGTIISRAAYGQGIANFFQQTWPF